MRHRLWKLVIPILMLTCLVSLDASPRQAANPEKAQLKTRQKAARQMMKTQEKNTNRALQQARITAAQRSQVKHQMKRQKHHLRDQQHEEMQDLKDRHKVIQERTSRS